MIEHDAHLKNLITVKNIIIRHFSSVSEPNSIVFDDVIINRESKNVDIRFSFTSNMTGKKHFISDYRIPSSVMLDSNDSELANTDYFINFDKFVSEDASSYLEHIKSEKTDMIISESIIFIKKIWPDVFFLATILYLLSI